MFVDDKKKSLKERSIRLSKQRKKNTKCASDKKFNQEKLKQPEHGLEPKLTKNAETVEALK